LSRYRTTAFIALTAAPLGGSFLAPAAFASDPAWNGQYALTVSANAKTGTSVSARHPESAHTGKFSFSSICSAGVCVAISSAPPPKDHYMPQSIKFTWIGSAWVREVSWNWDCLQPDGTFERDPADSETVYTPGPDGVLTGIFHTDILSGACKGSVDMPVSATPLQLPVI
jgi:hypothetical protein